MATFVVNFPSPASESRFKSVLSKVNVTAKVVKHENRVTLAIRPKDIQNFRENLFVFGLGHCPVTRELLTFLQDNPSEFLMFRAELPA